MELKIQSLSKKFKDKIAVDNFSVTLEKGIYGLLGPNGSGKSTLMRMLADVVYETEGNIYLKGIDKKDAKERIDDLLTFVNLQKDRKR